MTLSVFPNFILFGRPAANRIDVHNQYRQVISAIERTWKTRRWDFSIFQTIMDMTLMNCFLEYTFLANNHPLFGNFTNQVTIPMCAEGEEEHVSNLRPLSRVTLDVELSCSGGFEPHVHPQTDSSGVVAWTLPTCAAAILRRVPSLEGLE